MENVSSLINDINNYVKSMLNVLYDGKESVDEYINRVAALIELLNNIENVVPQAIYEYYSEYISEFGAFCTLCMKGDFLADNVDNMASSLNLLSEVLEEIASECKEKLRVCACCNSIVIYEPINTEDKLCSNCSSSNEDRLIVSYLKRIGLEKSKDGTKVLKTFASDSIDKWLMSSCPQIQYDSKYVFKDEENLSSDIRILREISERTYDVVIFSLVPECNQDYTEIMKNIERIIKDDGQAVIFDNNCSGMGLIGQFEKYFYVQQLSKEYFGSDIYRESGLSDASMLYVLTKGQNVTLEKEYTYEINMDLCEHGPLVSVIMSAYNHESFVAEAIESVIGQSYKNIEFIVCDDASSDNTAKVMQRYEKYYAKSVYYKENGQGRTVPLAKEFAHGKYIAIMHSDDIWEKDKLAIQIDYMEKHSGCATCLTWARHMDENANIDNTNNIFIQPNRNRYEWMRFFWEKGNALCNPSSVSRAEFFYTERYNGIFDRQLPDFFKWLWLVQKEDIYIIPNVLTYMRRHKNLKEFENTSAMNRDNLARHYVENAGGWLQVIRNMDSEFFVKTFADCLINPDASTEEEVMCEKYFLMLSHQNVLIQHDAICYLNEVYGKIKEVLEEKYKYTRKMIWDDELNKGLAKIL